MTYHHLIEVGNWREGFAQAKDGKAENYYDRRNRLNQALMNNLSVYNHIAFCISDLYLGLLKNSKQQTAD